MTNTNTTNTNETNTTNEEGPFFYALTKGKGKRVAVRFDRLFSAGGTNSHPQFIAFSNIPKYAQAIETLLTACNDHGLDRTNLTRSQIVMAYVKADKALLLIAKFIQLHGVQALLDNMNAAGVNVNQPVIDIRHSIIRSCANA